MGDRRGLWALVAGAVLCAAAAAGAATKGAVDADPDSGAWDVSPDGTYLGGHRGAVRAIAFSPDGTKLASGADDGNVVLWDTESKGAIKSLAVGSLPVRGVVFTADGKSVVVLHGPEVSLWDVESGAKTWAVTLDGGGVGSAIALAPKGDAVYVGDLTGTISVWRLKDHKKTSSWKAYEAEVRTLATSPKNALLAATGDASGGHYFALPKGKRVRDVSFADGAVVAFAPAGGHVALAGDLDIEPSPGVHATAPGVLILDVPDGDEITRVSLEASRGHVASVAWHKSGKLIAVAMTGDAPSLAIELNPKKYFMGEIGTSRACVAFSPDGTRLAAGSSAGTGMIGAYRVTAR